MQDRRPLRYAAFAAVLGLFSTSSHAILISATENNPYDFSWIYDTETTDGIVSGSGTLTVSGFNSSLLSVEVKLDNESPLATNRLTAFGFGIDPDATDADFDDVDDAGLIDATLSFIPSLALIEVCAYGGKKNCQGGGNGGIDGAESDTFTILLSGTWGSSVEVAPIGFKYQGAFTSYEFTTDRPPPPPTTVPEPSSWALFGLGMGLLGLGYTRRRRQSR